jgi:transposase-like protein
VKSYEEESQSSEYIRKADRRRCISVEERLRLLEELEGSPLTLKAFAELHGINYSTLAGWRHAQRRDAGLLPSAAIGREAKATLLEAVKILPSAEDAKGSQRFTEVCLRGEPEPLALTRQEANPLRNPASAPLEVTLRGGAVVRLVDLKQLAELLQLLGN